MSEHGSMAMGEHGPIVMLSPLLLSREQLAEVLGGCSASHIDRLDRSGKLGPRAVMLGGCKRWRADEVSRWVAADCPGRVRWDQQQSESGGGR